MFYGYDINSKIKISEVRLIGLDRILAHADGLYSIGKNPPGWHILLASSIRTS